MVSVASSSSPPTASAAASLRLVDACGVFLSGLCAVHCAVTPVLVTVLPAVAGEGTETGLRRGLMALGLVGVGLGTALHKDRRALVPLAGGLMLAALLELGAVVPAFEVFVSLAVSALLIAAHALNTRACNAHCHSCAPARYWTAQVEALGATGLGRGLLTAAVAILVHATLLAIALRVNALPLEASSPRAELLASDAVEVDLAALDLQAAVAATDLGVAAREPSVQEQRVQEQRAHVQSAPAAAVRSAALPSSVSHAAPASPVEPAVEPLRPVAFDDVLAAPATVPARFDEVLATTPGASGEGKTPGSGAPALSSGSSRGAVGRNAGVAGTSRLSGNVVDGAQLSRRPAQPPGLAARIEAHYPAAARAQGVSGVGRARLLVSPAGTIVAAEALSESPAGLGFADACVRALSGSRGWGEPLDASGRPVSTWIRFSCEFAIRH